MLNKDGQQIISRFTLGPCPRGKTMNLLCVVDCGTSGVANPGAFFASLGKIEYVSLWVRHFPKEQRFCFKDKTKAAKEEDKKDADDNDALGRGGLGNAEGGLPN